MFLKLKNKIRIFLRNFVFDEEYFCSADHSIKGSSSIMIIKKNNKTGHVEIISEYNSKDYTLRNLQRDVEILIKKYAIKECNVIRDIYIGMN